MSAASDPEHSMISEFGEPIGLRPGGCPHCGADFVTVYAGRCWRCERAFPPDEALNAEPEDGAQHP